jgi:putative photosynthetic complex assembly protein
MGDPFAGQPFPRGPLIGAAVLIGASLVLAGLGRMGIGRTELPAGTPVAAYELRFVDRADGGVDVFDPAGRPVGEFAPATNGFARGVLRSLARERRLERRGGEAPFRLTRWTDGRLSIADPETGREVALEVFGPTNSAAFARLWLTADAAARGSSAGAGATAPAAVAANLPPAR